MDQNHSVPYFKMFSQCFVGFLCLLLCILGGLSTGFDA